MRNKRSRIIANLIASGLVFNSIPVQAMENTIDSISKKNEVEENVENEVINDEILNQENEITDDTYANDNIITEQVKYNLNKNTENEIQNTSSDDINKNIVEDKVLEITLADGEYVPTSIKDNPDGYETIKVTTTGSKKLVKEDYDALRISKIPNVDLSNAYSDSIPNKAFYKATHLTSFKFPIGVKDIGDSAFTKCYYFTGELIIPNSVTSIGNSAFYECTGFTGSLVIPDSVTYIGDSAFHGCFGFTGDLIIGNSVTYIGDSAFFMCYSFTGNLIIPNSVTYINDCAFYMCFGLTGSLVIPDSVTYIGYCAFYECTGFTGELIIGNSVTYIGESAFDYCTGLTGSLVIPDSVISIEDTAFYGCSGFTGELIIGNSVTYIGDSAFYECTGFTGSLAIPDSVISIEENSFEGCNNIERIIIKIDDSFKDNEYRKTILEKLPKYKTYVEIPYNFDYSDMWLEASEYIKLKPVISTYVGSFDNNEGIGISLEIVETLAIKTIIINKDGEEYILEENENGEYIFNESGNYEVYIETELGTVSNISFKNTVPVSNPSINYTNEVVELIDNGTLKNENNTIVTIKSDILEYRINNGEWQKYVDSFKLDDYAGTDVKLEARVKYDVFVSEITSQIIKVKEYEKPKINYELSTNDWTNENVTIKINATDNVGIEKIIKPDLSEVFSNNVTFEAIENTEYEFKAVDTSGNVETIVVEINNIDKESPTIKYQVNKDNDGNVIIDFNVVDNLSGIKSFISKDNLNKLEDYKYKVDENGEYTFVATDNAENITNVIVKIDIIDNEKPKINYELSTNDWTNENVTIKINAADNVGIDKIILPNGNEISSSEVSFTVGENGSYIFKAIDEVGNEETITVVVDNIDKEKPSLSYELSTDKPSKENVTINVTATDNVVIYKIILPDGREVLSDKASFEVTKNGSYIFKAIDEAGNTNEVIVKIDTIKDSQITDPSNPDNPETRDNTANNIVLYGSLSILSSLGLIKLILKNKKENDKN